MSSTKTEVKIWWGVLILMLVLSGYLVQNTFNEKDAITDFETNIKAELAKYQDIEGSKRVYVKSKKDLESLNGRYVAYNGGEVAFIEELQEYGRAIGVKTQISSLSSETAKNIMKATSTTASVAPTFSWIKVSISLEGTWTSVNRYWSILESLPYRVEISRLNLASGSSGNMPSAWSASFDIMALQKR